ncbi:hypothetical protein BDW68DRAFT_193434 [Aspergillus falconensis]
MSSYLQPLPSSMNSTTAKWAYVSLGAIATPPGHFNRSALETPWATTDISNVNLSRSLSYLNTTDFVAYDKKFFDILGPNATIEHVQKLAFQSHEAPCYVKDTNQLFFVEWGPRGGDIENGTHSWQYLLDVETNELSKITTYPPLYNAHGCVFHNYSLYVLLCSAIWGLNDLEIDSRGNFYLTDSKSGWGRGITAFYTPHEPNRLLLRSTSRIKPVHITTGNANGIAISPDSRTLYIPDTGVSKYYPAEKTPYANRGLSAFDVSRSGSVLSNQRLLSNPISYFYDGIRVSRNGWIFCGAGDGVDVIDPETGFALGSILVGGGRILL